MLSGCRGNRKLKQTKKGCINYTVECKVGLNTLHEKPLNESVMQRDSDNRILLLDFLVYISTFQESLKRYSEVKKRRYINSLRLCST